MFKFQSMQIRRFDELCELRNLRIEKSRDNFIYHKPGKSGSDEAP